MLSRIRENIAPLRPLSRPLSNWEMTLSSLRTLLRVRLYTAISPTVDIADYTEMPTCSIPRKYRSSLALPPQSVLQQIPLQRQSRAPQICYQSAIALKYATAAQLHPIALAAALLETHQSLSPPPFRISIDANATGWLSLTLSWTEGSQFLDQVLERTSAARNAALLSQSASPAAMPFSVWQTLQRCRTLRSMMQRDPNAKLDADFDRGFSHPLPETQDLMTTLLDELDAADERSSDSMADPSVIAATSARITHAFDRLHRQIPLFHPKTLPSEQIQFFYCANWTEFTLKALYHQPHAAT